MKLSVSLNGNFLCPFQILIDIAAQLPTPSIPLNRFAFTPICELDTINDWINLESLGKPAALRAQMLMEMLNPILKANAIVIMKLHIDMGSHPLNSDNLYALLFLAQHLTRLALTFYVSSDNTEHLQHTVAAITANTNIVVEYIETNQPSMQPINTDLLVKNRHEVLKAVGFTFDEQWLSQPELSDNKTQTFIDYAWVCLKSGAYDLGVNVLAKALTQTILSGEKLFMHLQLVRFLSHQYTLVTNTAFPEHFNTLTPEEEKNLYFVKAYSATMSRNFEVAAIYFNKCQVDEHLQLTDENSLYRLNLHALFLALQGKVDTALMLEMRIKDFIKENNIQVAGLKYLNFINIARLYKKTGHPALALAYYEKAYDEISGGGYTHADHIYYNINMGRVHEAMGSFEIALLFWLKAAILWLEYPNKWTLSWRPRLILCHEKITDILAPLAMNSAHKFLYEKLVSLITSAGMQLDYSVGATLHFSTAPFTITNTSCYIANNIILFGSATNPAPRTAGVISANDKLSALVCVLTVQLLNIDDIEQTLTIDTRNERFFPATDESCWLLAKLSGCKRAYHDGRKIYYDQAQTNMLLTHTRISLAKAVTAVEISSDSVQLRYKRSFLNKTLSCPDEIELVTLLNEKKTLSLEQLPANIHPILMNLVAKNVLAINYPSNQAYIPFNHDELILN